MQKQFIAEIVAFIEANDMNRTVFGKAAMGDPSFVFELEQGRSPSIRTIERARAFMKQRQRGARAAA